MSNTYWNNILWFDKTKIELFGLNSCHQVWRKNNKKFQPENTTPTEKHEEQNVIEYVVVSHHMIEESFT